MSAVLEPEPVANDCRGAQCQAVTVAIDKDVELFAPWAIKAMSIMHLAQAEKK